MTNDRGSAPTPTAGPSGLRRRLRQNGVAVGPDHRHPSSQTAASHSHDGTRTQNTQLAIADDEGVTVIEVMNGAG
jgi:hypothetical protein